MVCRGESAALVECARLFVRECERLFVRECEGAAKLEVAVGTRMFDGSCDGVLGAVYTRGPATGHLVGAGFAV